MLRRAIGVVPQTPFLFQVQIVYSLTCCCSPGPFHATRLFWLGTWRVVLCGCYKEQSNAAIIPLHHPTAYGDQSNLSKLDGTCQSLGMFV